MKIVFISILALFVLVCNTNKANSNTTSSKVSVYGTPPNALGNEALKSTQARYSGWKTKSADSRSQAPIYKVLSELDKYTVSQCPYYRLDIETFYKEPSPKKILSSLFVPEDEVYFIGERDGQVKFNLILTKNGEKWEFDFAEDWNRVIGWLPGKLAEADSENFKIFKVGFLAYLTFNRNEKPVFFRITGEEITPEEFCENVVNMVNHNRQ